MNYRPAEKEDLKAIMELLDSSFDDVYAYYARKSFASTEHALLAEDGGGIGGVINWRIFEPGEEKLGYLFWVAVHPEARRKGIAEGLVLEATRWIREKNGPVDVYAAVDKHNEPSQRLFEKLGFTSNGRSVIKEKFGLKRFWLYSSMMLMPGEVLFLLPK
jgi:ribosomal protein S18 acetylase RimI-like enzyme